jgi:hypothetical protein
VINRRPRPEIPVFLLILFVGFSDGYQYASYRQRPSAEYSLSFNPAATAVGERAHLLQARGQRVLCVISRDASVVKYLSDYHDARIRIAEFYNRPLAPAELPLDEFRPNILLIENCPQFHAFTDRLRPELLVAHDDNFYEVRMQRQ